MCYSLRSAAAVNLALPVFIGESSKPELTYQFMKNSSYEIVVVTFTSVILTAACQNFIYQQWIEKVAVIDLTRALRDNNKQMGNSGSLLFFVCIQGIVLYFSQNVYGI